MAHAHEAKSIIEIACSSGLHSQVIANTYLKKGSRLVSSDFTMHWIKRLEETYAKSDFSQGKNCHTHFDAETDYVNDDKAMYELKQPKENEKIVMGC